MRFIQSFSTILLFNQIFLTSIPELTVDYFNHRLTEISSFYISYFKNITNLRLGATHDDINNADMARNPLQSFNILMNFNFDGTTGLIVMDQNNQQVVWTDRGHCPHGYMYDPTVSTCRQIFCEEGFQWSQKGCEPDANIIVDDSHRSSDVKLKLNLHILNNYIPCTEVGTDGKMKCDETFVYEIIKMFADVIQVSEERVKNLEIVEEKIITFDDTDFDWDWVNETYDHSNKAQHLSIKFVVTDKLPDKLYEKSPSKPTALPSRWTTSTLLEALQIFFHLKTLCQIKKIFQSNGRLYYPESVNEIVSKNQQRWCESPGDKKEYINNDQFRILIETVPNNTNKFYILLDTTGFLYETGYFFLQILYEPKHSILYDPELKKLELNKIEKINYANNKTFTDVTDIYLEKNSILTDSSQILIVCDRAPKIRIACSSHITVRVMICEFDFDKNLRRYCWKFPITYGDNQECISIDEYEYDEKEPETYLRICQEQQLKNGHNRKLTEKRSDISTIVAGWISMLSLLISIVFMVATLVTYALFKELRNIPGWNMINLTISLCLGQISFLIGSFVNVFPVICFIISIITHYGILASFFWMNVIAFDLWKNFRRKSSHVLLHMVRIKERLRVYGLFGWLSPIIIVLTSVLFDFFYVNSIFRPCYAMYLDDCQNFQKNKFIKTNEQNKFLNDMCYKSDLKYNSSINVSSTVSSACWLTNGTASLLFFALPVGLIIVTNGIFLLMTIYNIRKIKVGQKLSDLRRFSRVKLPGNDDVKFYIQMATIMGFTWVILYNILMHSFNILNGSIGVFIFFGFIFRPNVRNMYRNLIKNSKIYKKFKNDKAKSRLGKLNSCEPNVMLDCNRSLSLADGPYNLPGSDDTFDADRLPKVYIVSSLKNNQKIFPPLHNFDS